MRVGLFAALAVTLAASGAPAQPASPAAMGAERASGPVESERFHTRYIRLGPRSAEGLLYEPTAPGRNARIALVYAHPNANTFGEPLGPQMASRGYRVLMVNAHNDEGSDGAYAPAISAGIAYLRSLSGVTRVVVVGHSGGGHLIAFYAAVAERGPAACRGPEKVYSCAGEALSGLQRPDGVVLLDPTLGAFHQMSSVDPAAGETGRIAALDMFSPANGYDLAAKKAHYTPDFARRFHAAQAARNASIVDGALARLRTVEAGQGRFSDDEPLVISGMGVTSAGARLYQPDTAWLSHTKRPHLLLKADGSVSEQVVPSVRPPTGQQALGQLRSLEAMTQNTTVRRFLASSAIRTKPDFAITSDDIRGVEWNSAMSSTPANAEAITVPTLILTMSCHYLVVPGEIIFDHLAARDKSYASVEGATHLFQPCRPDYGDTVGRTFDYVDRWLSKDGRF